MNTSDTVFILGASDPEMAAIADILGVFAKDGRIGGVVQATAGGKPVHPGNAGKADAVDGIAGQHVVLVECRVANAVEAATVEIIDHHAPGDPGYGRPAAEYASASSIGQVWAWLAARDLVGGDLPPDFKIVAAADHCLGAAYRGECPGVDPAALRAWRAESRAAFQRTTVEAINAAVDAALVRLAELPAARVGGFAFWDARGREIPELPEAAAISGQGVMYSLFDARSGRTKVGVLNGTPEALTAWLAWARSPASGLADAYGDPARGFAGAYVK